MVHEAPAAVPTDGAPTGAPVPRRPSRGPGDRTWKIVSAVAALALVGFVVFVATRPRHPAAVPYPVSPPTTLATGTAAPAFSLPRLGGGAPVTLAATAGRPAVVNFFASWCRDCRAELGAFAAFARASSGRVAVVGVDANDGDGSAAQPLLAQVGADYPVGVDTRASTATAYLLTALPATFFLDAQGRIVHVALGAQTVASLDRWTRGLAAGGTG